MTELPWPKQCRVRGSLQPSLLTQRWVLLTLVAVSLLLEALSHFSLESRTQNLCGAIFCQLSSLLDCNMQRLLRMGGFKETTQPRFPSHTPLLISPAQNFRAFIMLLLYSLVSLCLFLPYYNKKKLFFLWINNSYACLVPLITPCTALGIQGSLYQDQPSPSSLIPWAASHVLTLLTLQASLVIGLGDST